MNKVLVLLAGGLSRRMGEDKALLNLGSQTLLEYMCAKLHDISKKVPESSLCIAIGDRKKSFASNLELCNAKLINDNFSKSGPLGGLEAALTAHKEELITTLFLFIPTDIPKVSEDFLLALLKRLEREVYLAEEGAIIVKSTESVMPMAIRFDVPAYNKLLDTLNDSKASYAVKHYISYLIETGGKVRSIDPVPGELLNINSQEDYLTLLQKV